MSTVTLVLSVITILNISWSVWTCLLYTSGYFAQNQASLLDENLTVFQTIDDVAKGEIRNKIRDLLGEMCIRDSLPVGRSDSGY